MTHVETPAAEAIRTLTRWVDDFPQPGIRFADLTPVFADADAFGGMIDALIAGAEADVVAGIDARGFLLAAAAARALGTGVLPIRKAGKLPPPVRSREYSLEYGTARLEIPADGVDLTGARVLLIDDVLATGGTLVAATELLAAAGATVTGIGVVLELGFLDGRDRLAPHPLASVLTL